MRSTLLKIGNEKREALLIAGGGGFKIYSATGVDGWVLVVQRKVTTIGTNSPDFKLVSSYVNLKYLPADQQETIESKFKSLVSSISDVTIAPSPDANL